MLFFLCLSVDWELTTQKSYAHQRFLQGPSYLHMFVFELMQKVNGRFMKTQQHSNIWIINFIISIRSFFPTKRAYREGTTDTHPIGVNIYRGKSRKKKWKNSAILWNNKERLMKSSQTSTEVAFSDWKIELGKFISDWFWYRDQTEQGTAIMNPSFRMSFAETFI